MVTFAQIQNLLRRKYTLPLIGIVTVFFISPLIEGFSRFFPLPQFLVMVIVLSLLRSLGVKKGLLFFLLALTATSLSADMYYRFHYGRGNTMPAVLALGLFLPAVMLYCTAIILILSEVFKEKTVTSDTVWGGIMVYFFIGIMWARLFHLAAALSPHAFVPTLTLSDPFQFFYFSLATLTTLGYGDISPGNHLTMILAVLESSVGQVYLAVFVARLIGLEISNRRNGI